MIIRFSRLQMKTNRVCDKREAETRRPARIVLTLYAHLFEKTDMPAATAFEANPEGQGRPAIEGAGCRPVPVSWFVRVWFVLSACTA
jgi:hypothetical protein